MNDNKINVEEKIFKGLSGILKHYCEDWDGMAIDEHCSEFEACHCFDDIDCMVRLKTVIKKDKETDYRYEGKKGMK